MKGERLTERQRRFAEAYLQHGDATRAHREAGFMPNASDRTRKCRASEMLKYPAVQAYIREQQERNAKAASMTAEKLIQKLEVAYKLADQDRRPAAMVSAVMGMARITGLDKQIIEHQTRSIELVINRPHGA